jgi:hypothetical protein
MIRERAEEEKPDRKRNASGKNGTRKPPDSDEFVEYAEIDEPPDNSFIHTDSHSHSAPITRKRPFTTQNLPDVSELPIKRTVPRVPLVLWPRYLSGGSFALVLLLGFMPWLEIRCNDEPLSTQSGYQVALGTASPIEDDHNRNEKKSTDQQKGGEEREFASSRVGIFFLLIITGFLLSVILRPSKFATRTLAFCSFLAVATLVIELHLGFPFEKELDGKTGLTWFTAEELSLVSGRTTTRGKRSPGGTWHVRRFAWLWITLVVAAVPQVVCVGSEWARWRLRRQPPEEGF